MTHTIKIYRSTSSGPIVMTFRAGDENTQQPLTDAKVGVANMNSALDQVKTWVATISGNVNEISIEIVSL